MLFIESIDFLLKERDISKYPDLMCSVCTLSSDVHCVLNSSLFMSSVFAYILTLCMQTTNQIRSKEERVIKDSFSIFYCGWGGE